jgi:hypothetical protein
MRNLSQKEIKVMKFQIFPPDELFLRAAWWEGFLPTSWS